jgi:hypothetical protein
MAWPTMIVPAMPNPKTPANDKNMISFAFDVAASAVSPIRWPIHMVLIDPPEDWRMLDAKVGGANSRNALLTGSDANPGVLQYLLEP